MIIKFQQREQELIAEVEKETKIEQDRVTKDKTDISDHLKKIEDSMFRAKHFIDCSTAADLVMAKPFVSKLYIARISIKRTDCLHLGNSHCLRGKQSFI